MRPELGNVKMTMALFFFFQNIGPEYFLIQICVNPDHLLLLSWLQGARVVGGTWPSKVQWLIICSLCEKL